MTEGWFTPVSLHFLAAQPLLPSYTFLSWVLFQDRGVRELEVHHEVAEGTVDVSAVALRRRVPRRVHEVDAHALRVDDVVGLVQRPDLLVPRDHRVLPEVRARCLDPGMGDSLFKCQYFCPHSLKASNS